MNRHIFAVVLFTISTGLLFSCKKDKDSLSPNYLLYSVTDSTTSVQAVTQFSYDNANRLSAIVVTGQSACRRTFQYIGNTVIFTVTDTTPGIRAEVDTIVLNSAGFITTMSGHYTNSTESYLETFFYDPTGQTSTGSVTSKNGIPGDTLEYETVNGDIMYEKVKGQPVNKNVFTYYASKDIVYGDPTDFRQLLYWGAYYYKNKHLLNVLASPNVSYKEYSYTFDGNRIATSTLRQWKAGVADTVTHNLRYSYISK